MKDISKGDIRTNIPLVSLKKDSERTVVKVGNVSFGKDEFIVIAGPCTVESREQILDIAREVKLRGAKILRGGAFKPLTFPYRSDSFFELGEMGLEYLKEAKEKHKIPIVTELMDIKHLDTLSECADMIQIGSRNMQNFPLLEEIAKSKMPVLLKRHFGCSLRDWLGAAEYLLYHGNANVVLCERGIVAPHTHQLTSRFIVDLQVVLAAKEFSHLPIIVDPSHSTFKRSYVPAVARAACAIGADGLIIDVHPDPEKAAVDPLNAITYDVFENLMRELSIISKVVKKNIG